MNDIIKVEDFGFDNIPIDKKSHGTILTYDISYETLIRSKLLLIKFDETDGFIRIYDETRYLVLFGPGIFDTIYNRIKYLLCQKSGIT